MSQLPTTWLELPGHRPPKIDIPIPDIVVVDVQATGKEIAAVHTETGRDFIA